MNAVALTLLSVVLSAIVAVLLTVVVERLKKPRLRIEIAQPMEWQGGGQIPARAKWLGITVRNDPLPFWARWLTRSAALHCRGLVTFLHLDGQDVFGRTLTARWAETPEPIALSGQCGGQPFTLFDPHRLTAVVDIHPGFSKRLDVVGRFDSEASCFGWHNGSYFHRWRDPDWELPAGRYRIKAVVEAANASDDVVIALANDVAVSAFRLLDGGG